MSWRAALGGRAVGSWKNLAVEWGLAAAVGLIFLLPHAVRIAELGSYAAYSPWSARTLSSMVFDETFLYSAEANYTLTRGGAPGYDDTWEHRATVYPYSILPTTIEAGLAVMTRSLKLAQIVSSFLFPFLTAWVLAALFAKAGAGRVTAATLALLTLTVAFSPLTLVMDVRAFLLHGHGTRVFDTLQASRNPNPGMTFLQFLASLLLLARAMLCGRTQNSVRSDMQRSIVWATAAGALGGLLYFSYIYYAIAWSVMLGLLALGALLPWRPARRYVPRTVWLSLAITVVFASLFLVWQHQARVHGNYEARATRIGLYHLHTMAPGSAGETSFWGAWALACAGLWRWLRHRHTDGERRNFADVMMLLLLAAMAGGLAGLNMQLVTGFNLQQVQHYPHMVLQPVGFLMLAVLVALASRDTRSWRLGAGIGFALLMTASTLAQVEAGRDTAPMHAVSQDERALFAWLNANSPVGSVVATNDLELSLILPTMTHNSVLYADGSRSSASDDELMERLLLVSRLEGATSQELASELAGNVSPGEKVSMTNYAFYLYEFSAKYQPFRAARQIAPELVPALIQQYQAMDPAQELDRFRVDYLWLRGGASPATPPTIPGWRFAAVFSSDQGKLWQLSRVP